MLFHEISKPQMYEIVWPDWAILNVLAYKNLLQM